VRVRHEQVHDLIEECRRDLFHAAISPWLDWLTQA